MQEVTWNINVSYSGLTPPIFFGKFVSKYDAISGTDQDQTETDSALHWIVNIKTKKFNVFSL